MCLKPGRLTGQTDAPTYFFLTRHFSLVIKKKITKRFSHLTSFVTVVPAFSFHDELSELEGGCFVWLLVFLVSDLFCELYLCHGSLADLPDDQFLSTDHPGPAALIHLH